MSKKSGNLIVIGGHEEKNVNDERAILKEVVAPIAGTRKRLVIMTAATSLPKEVADEYRHVFHSLGVKTIGILHIRNREEASDPATIKNLDHADVLYFTGGDQLRITSQIGGTPLFAAMIERHKQGCIIAGTSAGAAAMPETMLICGQGESSLRISVSTLGMAPGLGFVKGAVIDTHFAERGRFGRLIGAVTQNPYNLGIGIDENTALVIENDTTSRVIGAGAVYIFDGAHVTYSSFSEDKPAGALGAHDLRLHVLGDGDRFDLASRRPLDVKK